MDNGPGRCDSHRRRRLTSSVRAISEVPYALDANHFPHCRILPSRCIACTCSRRGSRHDALRVLSDSPKVTKDWGFSALIEHDGKSILFDTGNNAEIFEHNLKVLNTDLTRLDFVVISHRHADHTTGLKYLLSLNPNVSIYAPMESFGIFGGRFLLPYYDGEYPDKIPTGHPWSGGKFVLIDRRTD
jgi:7,8-dihydropterin-6-yl-methyl-4-(beta-D-ribofuranosyl)aminobenzene 5'-phosphate synthase